MFSKWNKIDLHIHTDYSNKTKKKDYKCNFSLITLCKKVKQENVDMISLTDHNIINCKAYDELSKLQLKYLVGVELDTTITNNDLTNYVTRIMDKQNNTKINVKPFHALILFKSQDHNQISAKLESMYKQISNSVLKNLNINLDTNKFLRVTTINHIIRTFRDEDFFIIAHGDKSKGLKEHCQNANNMIEAQYEILVGDISALEMKSNANMENVINKYNEDFLTLIENEFKVEPTSYVVFSDNHNCNEYKLNKFATWIKGNTDFETLRLSFSDPESRIHTSDKEPSSNIAYIEAMDLSIKDKLNTINFSPYLNVIIGGRSSGKSLLLNSLVQMINDFNDEKKAIFKKSYSKIVNIEKSNAKLKMGNKTNNISISAEAFCQEEIINLFQNNEKLGKNLSNEFSPPDENKIKKIHDELDSLANDFYLYYNNYKKVNSKIDKGDIKNYIKNSTKDSKKIFNINVLSLKKINSKEDYDKITSSLDKINYDLEQLKQTKFNNLKIFSSNDITIIDQLLKLLITKRSQITKTHSQNTIHDLFIDKIQIINKEYTSNELTNKLKEIESSKLLLDNDLKDYKTFFKSKFELKKICYEIERIEKYIPDIIKTKDKYKFVTKINMNIKGKEIVENFFNSKILHYDETLNLFRNILNLANPNINECRIKQIPINGKDPDKLNELFKDYIKTIKNNITYEILECLENGTEISTEATSQGKKASIFLDIKLKNLLINTDKNILLIDQLEDNIDNKFISEQLVTIIRKLKTKMQVILVTHNPSLAIYGDAENIIIAENNNKQISYKQGGLENISIRKEACKILDGGEIAFKNRMDKYNINILKGINK